jgi:hypothetical protein
VVAGDRVEAARGETAIAGVAGRRAQVDLEVAARVGGKAIQQQVPPRAHHAAHRRLAARLEAGHAQRGLEPEQHQSGRDDDEGRVTEQAA